MIRVGTRKGSKDPSFKNFVKVVSLTKSTNYFDLSPYSLTDSDGRIMENLWQGSKVYESVPKSTQRRTRFDHTIIWDHPAEKHVNGVSNGEVNLTDEFWDWREKLMAAPEPIRYPVGKKHRHECLYAFWDDTHDKLDYISSRKKIYVPLYLDLVLGQDQLL